MGAGSVGRCTGEAARKPKGRGDVESLFLGRPLGASQMPGDDKLNRLGRRKGEDRAPPCEAGAELALAESGDRWEARGGGVKPRLVGGVDDSDRLGVIGLSPCLTGQEAVDCVDDRGGRGP